jgi:tetratricopeptide (TPR) repeat protein
MFVGIAKFWDGADAEAVAWLRRSIEANRNFPFTHFLLAAALAWLGALDEARAAVQAGLALNPSFTLRRYRAGASSDNPAYLAGREHTYEGLNGRGAGGVMSEMGQTEKNSVRVPGCTGTLIADIGSGT